MVQLPVQLPVASSWALTEYRTRSVSANADASGVAQVDFGQLRDDEVWLIDHAVVICSSSTPTQLRWYTGSVSPYNLVDGSSAGDFDVADWNAGLQIPTSSTLIAQWTGCTPGALAVCSIQFRVLRRS